MNLAGTARLRLGLMLQPFGTKEGMMNRRMAIGLAGVLFLAGAVQAQELCHWDVAHHFYRMNSTTGSVIDSIFNESGGFAIVNDATGASAVVEANLDLNTTNWVRQEHLAYTDMGLPQLVIISDPSCIVRTGQETSYRAGDDGDLQPGHTWPPRFTVQANTNLVVDNLTGLMWTRNAGLGSGDWNFCVDYGFIPEWYGYSGWRLPSVRELESLLDYGQAAWALPFGHPFNNVQLNYWSGTGDVIDTNKAWVIGMGDGTIARWVRTNDTPYAWPVRTHTTGKFPVPKTGQTNSLREGDDGDLQPGVEWPVPRFTVMTDTNLVFDNLTGRMWTRKIGIEATTSWATAVDHCLAFELGGYDDWRMPSRRELWSLVDYGTTSSLPDGHPFTGTPLAAFWTSTSYRPLPASYAWGLSGGYMGAYDKTSLGGDVWPVRGDW